MLSTCCWPDWSENLNFTTLCAVNCWCNWTLSQMENKCFYRHWHNVRWLTLKSKACHFNNLTLIRIHEGGLPDFPPLWLCMCACECVVCVWERVCGRTFVYVHDWDTAECEKSDGGVSAGKTDSKTTSNILFSLVGCQTRNKKKEKSNQKQKRPTFSTPAYRHHGLVLEELMTQMRKQPSS